MTVNPCSSGVKFRSNGTIVQNVSQPDLLTYKETPPVADQLSVGRQIDMLAGSVPAAIGRPPRFSPSTPM